MDRRIKPPLPRHIAIALCALRFNDSRPEGLRTLEDQEWERVLSYTDSAHLTLHLATVCRDYFPQWVKERTARNLSDNGERFIRIKEAYQDLANAFRVAGVEHLVLKGFSHWPDYVENPRLRLQSDIDLFCPPQSIIKARATLESIGYRAVPTGPGIDHIPIMIRQSGWQWKGNLYDPKLPPHVEIHYQLWSSDRHRFGPVHTEDFWRRSSLRQVEDLIFPALHWVDTLGFAALQVLRDLLNHGLSTHKVFEVARFLHTNANNEVFWQNWMSLHEPATRRAEAVAFHLAVDCFGCDMHPVVAQELKLLPTLSRRWIGEYSTTSLNSEKMNKDALWLHIALIQSLQEKLAVLFRELVPTRIKNDPDTHLVTDDGFVLAKASRRKLRHGLFALSRVPFHARLIPITLWHGLKLYLPRGATRNSTLEGGL
jgi:hypothetical protein